MNAGRSQLSPCGRLLSVKIASDAACLSSLIEREMFGVETA
jgi:hypothetical protein